MKNMHAHKFILCLLVMLTSAGMASAQSFSTEFTSGEGYADGPLENNANWSRLYGSAGLFSVEDAAGSGKVQVGSTTASLNIYVNPTTVYDATVTSGSFSYSSDFQFTDSGSDSAAANDFFTLQYSLNPNGSGTEVRTNTSMRKNGSAYQLAFFGTGTTPLSASALGVDTGNSDFQSDLLRLSAVFEAGATASDWTGTYTLYNVTTATQVVSNTINLVASGFTDFVADSSVYVGMATDQNNYDGISDLEVLNFSSSYVIPEPSSIFLMGMGVLAVLGVSRHRRS